MGWENTIKEKNEERKKIRKNNWFNNWFQRRDEIVTDKNQSKIKGSDFMRYCLVRWYLS